MIGNMVGFLVALGLTYAKDPVRVPGDLNVEDLVNATFVVMPDETTLACDTAEVSEFEADSTVSTYISADTVYVSKLLATDSSVFFNGKVNITGTVTYSSKVQISMHKQKGSAQHPLLLQIQQEHEQRFSFKEQDFLFITDSASVTLPKHEFLQVIANCHCEHGQAFLLIDDNIQWMQSCQGTQHVQLTVEHESPSAFLSFKGCSEIGPLWVNIK